MSHDHLVVIANSGDCYALRSFDVPERSRTAQGAPIGELLPKLPVGVGISTIVPLRPNDDKRTLLLLSKMGKVKRVNLAALGCAFCRRVACCCPLLNLHGLGCTG